MKKAILLVILALILTFSLCACNLIHQHTFSAGYVNDDQNHWHKATCGHDVKDGVEAHTYDEGVPDGKGNVIFSCTKCGYQKTEEASEVPHEHVYPTDWKVEKKPTLDEKGVESRTCTLCPHKETRDIDKLTVKKIEITASPSRTAYEAGETFDKSGMVVTATLSDDSTLTVTDYTVDKTTLSTSDNFVTVTFRGATVKVSISVKAASANAVNVSQLTEDKVNTSFKVTGYYVGVAQEGPNADKEVLVKDLSADDIIAVRNVPYGIFPDVGYDFGDKIEFSAKLCKDSSADTPGKLYLEFVDSNGTIDSTIISSGEAVSFALRDIAEVRSQAELAALFKVGTIKPYTFVRLSGDVFFNKFTSSNDGKVTYYVHMNEGAKALADAKPDGTRAVSMRDDVNTQNLGADWKKLFFDSEPSGWPGVKTSMNVIALYTGANAAYFQLTVLSSDMVRKFDGTTNAEALAEVGWAFYRKGTMIQYDQKQSRRNVNASPEDATAEHTLYMDCSSFVNAVYNETFGINVMPYSVFDKQPKTSLYSSYARDNPDNPDVIGYFDTSKYPTEKEQKDLLARLKADLKVGDILVYQHGATEATMTGHVYIYVGDNTWLHCTGGDYQYNTEDPAESTDFAYDIEKNKGAIQTITSSPMFDDTTNAKYLFGKKTNNTVFNFTMLRPMNRGVTITPKTRDRMSVKGLVIEKSANVGLYGAAYKGDVITYTITLKNSTATAVNSVKVTDVIGPAASYVAGSANAGASVSGKNIAWTTDVAANATVKLSYQVKVAENTDQKALLSTGACVNNLPISEVQHTISGYTAAQIAKVVATANKFISDGRTFSNATEMLKAVYKESLSVDVFTHTKVSALLADLIDSSGKVARTDTAVSKMIVPNLYGGKTISNRYLWDNDRVRMVREEYLAPGDLIVADFNGGNNAAAYVYLGGGRLLAWYSGNGGKVQEVSITKDAYTNILVTLIAYERYAVLRPSMVA